MVCHITRAMPPMASRKPVIVSTGVVSSASSNLKPPMTGTSMTIASRQPISSAMPMNMELGDFSTFEEVLVILTNITDVIYVTQPLFTLQSIVISWNYMSDTNLI